MPQSGYITDELTDYAMEWLKGRKKRSAVLPLPVTQGRARRLRAGRASQGTVCGKAVRAAADDGRHAGELRRASRCGSVTSATAGTASIFRITATRNIAEYYRQYAETLLAVDDSVGRIVALLRESGLLDSTIVIFMGDNGFAFGEHGLIDKRTAYEESMRVPLLDVGRRAARRADRSKKWSRTSTSRRPCSKPPALTPPPMDGRSFLPLARGERMPWRETLLYEYYWERNFPQTPAMHAMRGARYKYIRYYGIWDTDELYDLRADPLGDA